MVDEQTGAGASGGQTGGGQTGGNGGGGASGGGKPNPVPNPNIMLRKGAQPITVDGEVNAGMDKNPILFPDKVTQAAGWYHPRAAEILALFGDRYIAVKPLGE